MLQRIFQKKSRSHRLEGLLLLSYSLLTSVRLFFMCAGTRLTCACKVFNETHYLQFFNYSCHRKMCLFGELDVSQTERKIGGFLYHVSCFPLLSYFSLHVHDMFTLEHNTCKFAAALFAQCIRHTQQRR